MSAPRVWLGLAALVAGVTACAPTGSSSVEPCADPADPACAGDDGASLACADDEALRIYRRRIEPLLRDERPSSCNRCHLTELDLALFVRGTPCESMACLEEKGLVDLERPDDSLILRWIRRGEVGGRDAAGRAARQEYAGFREWIAYSARCHATVCGDVEDPCGDRRRRLDAGAAAPGEERPLADGGAEPRDGATAAPDAGRTPGDAGRPPRDAGHSAADGGPDAGDVSVPVDAAPIDGPCGEHTLVTLFAERVHRWRNRCHHCHAPDGITSGVGGAPQWLAEGEGRAAARQTMRNVLERGLVDVESPRESLLLLKPLAERAGGVRHGGGTKFPDTSDEAYLDFLAWIERYAGCVAPSPDAGPAAPRDGGSP